MIKIRSEQELNMIRGKMLVAVASREELHDFLRYVSVLEGIVSSLTIRFGNCDSLDDMMLTIAEDPTTLTELVEEAKQISPS